MRSKPIAIFASMALSVVSGACLSDGKDACSKPSDCLDGYHCHSDGRCRDRPEQTTGAGSSSSSLGGASTAASGSSSSSAASGSSSGGSSSALMTAENPVFGGDHGDPHVLRVEDSSGRAAYYLTATVDTGDIPVFFSRDLLSWSVATPGLFGRTAEPAASLELNGQHFCHLWAPQLVEVAAGSYLLSFSAVRFDTPQAPCPPYANDGGVYLASAGSPLGPFAPVDRPWEPLPAGGHITDCPSDVRLEVPHSPEAASSNCEGGPCHWLVRLDSDVFRDPLTSRWWLAYSWFTNVPPQSAWERGNLGEHTHIVELDAADPFTVLCDRAVPQLFVANPHDGELMSQLANSCPRCGEMLSFTRGRQGEEVLYGGYSWGVAEGANLFRRGAWVYALISGGLWDSAYYHVYWVAAPTVEELVFDSPSRRVGRYLIPSQGQSFGHGTVVLGPDRISHYFVHHRLDHAACRDAGLCSRDVFVSPVEFEDRQDGLGDVYIKPRFPAEDRTVRVAVPQP